MACSQTRINYSSLSCLHLVLQAIIDEPQVVNPLPSKRICKLQSLITYLFYTPVVVFKSHHIPTGDLSAGDLTANPRGQGASNNDVFGTSGVGYNGDFINTVGVIGHPSAVGVVTLMDLATEMEWKMEYQSWLFLAKMACGHGVLRPESMLELVA